MQLTCHILETAMPIRAVEMSHFQLVVGTRSCRRLDGTGGPRHGVRVLVFLAIQHLAVALGEARIGAVLLGRQRMPRHCVMLLILHVMGHGRSHGSVHGEVVVRGLHVGRSLQDHVFRGHLRCGAHVLRVAVVLARDPLAGIER